MPLPKIEIRYTLFFPIISVLFLINNSIYAQCDFSHQITFSDTTLCNYQSLELTQNIKYKNPNGSLNPKAFWLDPQRYTQEKESSIIYFDNDSVHFNQETISHKFDHPGIHRVRIISTDSNNCNDTIERLVFQSESIVGFTLTAYQDSCTEIIDIEKNQFFTEDSTGHFKPDSIASDTWCIDGDKYWGEIEQLKRNLKHLTYLVREVETEYGCQVLSLDTIHSLGYTPIFEFQQSVWWIPDSTLICIGDSIDMVTRFENIDSNTRSYIDWGDGDTSHVDHIYDDVVSHGYTKLGVSLINLNFTIETDSGHTCDVQYPEVQEWPDPYRSVKVLERKQAEFSLPLNPTEVGRATPLVLDLDPVYTEVSLNLGNGDTMFRPYTPDTLWITYHNPGEYAIKMTPEYFTPQFVPVCPMTHVDTLLVVEKLSINDPLVSKIKIYPNPGSYNIVEIPEGHGFTYYTIHSSLGEIVSQNPIYGTKFEIDEQLPSGVYFIHLVNSQGSYKVLKLVRN
ncbi:T9SS type A sorting domain-containing protein [bacterium]|nr:T9SS type A sorting domain-containing protein [bacterium]